MRISILRGHWCGQLCLAAALALTAAPSALAFDYFWVGTTGPWTSGSNWDQTIPPDATFEEVGIINNGGTATLSTTAIDAAGLALGVGAADSGSLIIQSGGSLTLVETGGAAGTVAPVGTANIAIAGDGLLEIQGGGSLTSVLFDVNQTGVVRVGTSGAGAATLATTGGFFNDGTFEVQGPGHTLSIAGSATLEGNSRYVANLTGLDHSKLVAGGAINLGGTLVLNPVGGYMPTPSDSWVLFDAPSVAGSFASIDISALPAPGVGQAYRISSQAGGSGELVSVGLQSFAVLTINADTGATSFSSPSGAPIDIVGYSILSSNGLLNPAGWNSLDNQGVTGWDEAGMSDATALSELKFDAGGLVVGAASTSLGSTYIAPTEFGVASDIVFEYVEQGATESTTGIVQYSGSSAQNNLIVTVDPATGQAQLKNSSVFTINLQGYSVLSTSGSLLTGWNSLDDQGVSGWEEANPTVNTLSELNPTGLLTLAAGAAYDLGTMFDTLGNQDLTLEFLLADEMQTRDGVVVYAAVGPGIPGDYNNNGVVDAADYTVWRDGNSPDDTQAGYTLWKNNYGSTAASISLATSVPEPVSLATFGVGVVMWVGGARRRI